MKTRFSLLGATVLMVALFLNRSLADVHYVDAGNPTPVSPYTNWLIAATTIQQAIDVAEAGDEVVVMDGLYATGGRAVAGSMTNRVVVDKALTLRSVNGPLFTAILGDQSLNDVKIRCLFLASNSALSGFTLTNGATRYLGDATREQSGGGIWCESRSVVVSNCVVTGNFAYNEGGGVYGGTLRNCVLSNNLSYYGGGGVANASLVDTIVSSNWASHYGGGVYDCALSCCSLSNNAAYTSTWLCYGGGASHSRLTNCLVIGNAAISGGGTYLSTLYQCLLNGNSAEPGYKYSFFGDGGGAHSGTLIQCTIMGNHAASGDPPDGFSSGGGAAYAQLYNCIVSGNWAYQDGPWPPSYSDNVYACGLFSSFDYRWWSPTNPGLTQSHRLLSNSPCINAGNNVYVDTGTDLDGNPRIVGGTVDQGAYESQSPALLTYFNWLQSFGLETGASTHYADVDGDGMNNWREWRTWTVPTNSLSVFRMLPPLNTQTGVVVQWVSVSGKNYSVERGENLSTNSNFTLLTGSLIGQPGFSSCLDTNPPSIGPVFYRARVTGP